MKYMGWSWTDLEATPEYVRRYSWDLMQARLAAEQAAHEKAMAKHKPEASSGS